MSDDAQNTRDLVQLGVSALDDLVSILLAGAPTATVRTLVDLYSARQARIAREELLGALEQGGLPASVVSQDELLSVIARYVAAARDGAARRNLRLLARTMAGLASDEALTSDNFAEETVGLADLTREQLAVVGRYLRLLKEELGGDLRAEGQEGDEEWGGARSRSYRRLKDELVPDPYATSSDLETVFGPLVGNGLMLAASGYGALVYMPSSRLIRQARNIDLEALSDVV